MLLRPETIAENENDARHPLKAARTILTVLNQVKIASRLFIYLILLTHLSYAETPESRSRRSAIDRCRTTNKSVSGTALQWPVVWI
jgi:hypothetical protein